jgi:hypothetical protein
MLAVEERGGFAARFRGRLLLAGALTAPTLIAAVLAALAHAASSSVCGGFSSAE